jgi:hypothetical protein
MGFKQVGDWDVAKRILAAGPAKMNRAIQKTLLQEAHLYRKEIVQGLRKGAPGGKKMRPIAKSTKQGRKFRGFGGSKPLIRTGDLRNSVQIVKRSAAVFVGVPRSARGKDGRSLVNIARVHEYGSRPIVIKISPKMRRLLAAMFRKTASKATQKASGGRAGGATLMVIQIPARPFMRPVELKLRKGRAKRVQARMSKNLGKDFG